MQRHDDIFKKVFTALVANGVLFFTISEQILDYDDFKNDTTYEEYELYEDGFGFAEREGAETWDGEVKGTTSSEWSSDL